MAKTHKLKNQAFLKQIVEVFRHFEIFKIELTVFQPTLYLTMRVLKNTTAILTSHAQQIQKTSDGCSTTAKILFKGCICGITSYFDTPPPRFIAPMLLKVLLTSKPEIPKRGMQTENKTLLQTLYQPLSLKYLLAPYNTNNLIQTYTKRLLLRQFTSKLYILLKYFFFNKLLTLFEITLFKV